MRISLTLLLWAFIVLATAQVRIIAHRGASRLAPENTIAAVQLAYQLNADAVEVDVQLTADDEVMVHHDKTTYRCSGGTSDYVLAETHSTTLNQVDVGHWKDPKFKGEMLPYLRDVLLLVPEGKRLVIEVKCGPEIIPALQQVLAESGKQAQCDFIGFSWETICLIHDAFPDNAAYFIRKMPWRLKKKMQEAAAVGLTGVDLHYKTVNKRRITLAQEMGLDLICWTLDKPRDVKKMKKLGLSAITTNCPSLYTVNKYRLPQGQ